jgi:S-adenosylmethionine:tRNA ribosyltransferase-isomerase
MRASDFDYALPEELIAQAPLPQRDQSRMLVLHRATRQIEHLQFPDLLKFVRPGDVMVFNDSKVIPARLRPRTHVAEMLLVEEVAPNDWWVMLRPAKRAPIGTQILLTENIVASVTQINADGHRRVKFSGVENVMDMVPLLGQTPLPPYIKRPADLNDDERYQTVFAKHTGSVAAPTAGLHFTPELLERLRRYGVQTAFVTLHVGLGTFAPVKTDNVEEHTMHEEPFVVPVETAEKIATAQRVIAVGTTSVRVMESTHGKAGAGRTRIFIYPPYQFQVVDALLTNFHLPRSTLLMLVSAFAGRELVLTAYEEAIRERYRFFSYGDAMLIL